jgi:transaldolase
MKFFIDTANLDEIQEAKDLGILDGVTTNPSLMAKEGISGKDNIFSHYRKICDLVDGDVSAEVISTDFEGMIAEADELVDIASNIVIKIPMIRDGVKALAHLRDRDIKIVDSAEAGADVVTCPLDSIMGLLKHPLTDIGLEKFLADHNKAAQ